MTEDYIRADAVRLSERRDNIDSIRVSGLSIHLQSESKHPCQDIAHADVKN